MDFNDQRAEQLRKYFALMVPHCIADLHRRGVTDAQEEARRLYAQPGFMDRLTYCESMLHGRFDEDRNNSKLAYAEVIAAMSLMPGGVEVWGLRFDAARGPFWYALIPGGPVTASGAYGPLFAGVQP
jgi:hypothetical protein